jgi:hypothetical protein
VTAGLPLLIANLGAEEAPGELEAAEPLAGAAALWRELFRAPDFPWLPGPEGAAAWLNTEEAARASRAAGRSLFGASPEVVRRVHDKAFAHALAERAGLLPPVLRGALALLEPGELLPPEAGVAALAARLAGLPEWARRDFTLKPRFGTSGRGRVAGSRGRADTPQIRGALARLAAQGGALLEPWLRRREDLSAQLFVPRGAAPVLLGTTLALVSPAGVYRGQRGAVDGAGRVESGSAHDAELRAAAACAARAAAEAGFWGPCGVDAFSFTGPDGARAFRPLAELNARFTFGTVALGLVRRYRRRAAERLGAGAAERCVFHFALAAPARGWPAASQDLARFPLSDGEGGAGLVFARDEASLARALGEES